MNSSKPVPRSTGFLLVWSMKMSWTFISKVTLGQRLLMGMYLVRGTLIFVPGIKFCRGTKPFYFTEKKTNSESTLSCLVNVGLRTEGPDCKWNFIENIITELNNYNGIRERSCMEGWIAVCLLYDSFIWLCQSKQFAAVSFVHNQETQRPSELQRFSHFCMPWYHLN